MTEFPAHTAVDRFLQAFPAVFLLLGRQKPVFDPQLSNKHVGFRYSQCINDQAFKLTYDVGQRFEKNKSGIVLADHAAAHDSLQYGTRVKHHTTAFDLLLLL